MAKHILMKFSTKTNYALVSFVQKFFLNLFKLTNTEIHQKKVKRNNISWVLDLDEVIDFMIYLFGGFDLKGSNTFKNKLKKDDVVFDVGANIGSFSLAIADKIPEGRIFAFEPSDYAFNKFNKNIDFNPLLSPQIETLQAFVTAESKSVPEGIHASWNVLSDQKKHENHCGILTPTKGAQSVSLDDLVKLYGVEKLNWLKIDVDGYEKDVLLGGQNVFINHRPKVFMELCAYSLEEQGTSVEEILGFLIEHNYEFYGTDETYFATDVSKIVKQIPEMGTINIFAYPLT